MFCWGNYGTIVNLRINNPKIQISGFGVFKDYAGMIAARNYGTIEKCIVYNPTFISGRAQDYCNVAAIAADNSGTVKNCLVFGTYTLNTMANGDGFSSNYFVAETTEANQCVFAASVVENGKTTNNTLSPNEHDTNAAELGNWVSEDSAYRATNLSSAWYKYKVGYSGEEDLRVFLRGFISFTYYDFIVSPTDSGTVSATSLTVPTKYKAISYSTTKETNDTINVYGEKIIASANSNYSFTGWSVDGIVVTANFAILTYDLTFVISPNTRLIYSVDGGAFATATTDYFQTVSISTEIEMTNTSMVKEGCYSTWQFEFTNFSNQNVVVKYEISDNKYFISGYDNKVASQTNFGGTTKVDLNFTVTSNTQFKSVIVLKTYNSTFG